MSKLVVVYTVAGMALFGALFENQAVTDRFLGTIAGTVPIQEFYSPENIQRITGAPAS